MNSAKRKQFSLEEKKRIIDEVSNAGKKKGDVAKKYGITPSTLSTFLKNKEKITEQLQKPAIGPQRKRLRQAQFQDVDSATFTWFQDVRSRNVPISGPLIREKAVQFAKTLGVTDFEASGGWLNRFKDRYGIVAKTICGEASAAPMENVNEWRAGEVAKIIQTYSPDDVFNTDESGIFFQLEPDKTLAMKNDKCVGGKRSKQRLTALFCCNQSGTEKRKVLVIGRSQKPRCLKGVQSLPCDYKANRKAWMMQTIFNEWLLKFDSDMKRKKRKILLLVDNCTAHNEPPQLENIRVEYFLPNCTAVLQPLDQGILKSVKDHYKCMLMKLILLGIEKNDSIKVNVKDALHMISGAWGKVSEATIKNSWRHAKLIDCETEPENDATDTDTDLSASLEAVWNALQTSASVPTDVSLEDFLHADNNILTTYELSDADIIESISDNRNEEIAESSEDDEIDSTPPLRVSACEALSCLEKVRHFVSGQTNVPDETFTHLHSLQELLVSAATKSHFQTKITDFFKM